MYWYALMIKSDKSIAGPMSVMSSSLIASIPIDILQNISPITFFYPHGSGGILLHLKIPQLHVFILERLA